MHSLDDHLADCTNTTRDAGGEKAIVLRMPFAYKKRVRQETQNPEEFATNQPTQDEKDVCDEITCYRSALRLPGLSSPWWPSYTTPSTVEANCSRYLLHDCGQIHARDLLI